MLPGESHLIARVFRLFVGFFGPPALAVLFADIFVFGTVNFLSLQTPLALLTSYLRILGFVYSWIFFPAGLYTVLMEFCVNPYIRGQHAVAFVGGLTGVILCSGFISTLGWGIVLCALLSGWLSGYLLFYLYRFSAFSIE